MHLNLVSTIASVKSLTQSVGRASDTHSLLWLCFLLRPQNEVKQKRPSQGNGKFFTHIKRYLFALAFFSLSSISTSSRFAKNEIKSKINIVEISKLPRFFFSPRFLTTFSPHLSCIKFADASKAMETCLHKLLIEIFFCVHHR